MAKTRTDKTKGDKGANGAGKETALTESAAAKGADAETAPRPRVSPFKFLQQVRQETSKVTWPTRRETMITTVMVFIMVIFAALFFLAVDEILGNLVRLVLRLG